MKKFLIVVGVLFAAVAVLWVYNNVNETVTTTKPQPTVSNSEPIVSAPETDSSVIVVTGHVTPVYNQ